MIKMFITNAFVSKGYKDTPAVQFSGNGKAVRFKIGHRVYDKNAKDNHRYINLAVKAFGPLCERIEKMGIKEGSSVNIIGRYDEEKWEADGQEYCRAIVIIEEIEYSGSITKSENNENRGNGSVEGSSNSSVTTPANGSKEKPPTQNRPDGQPAMPSGFTGYESFGGDNPFFPTGN
jgi:hypothetical protein